VSTSSPFKIGELKGERHHSRLLSFGKYLELLIYSPYLAHLSPPLCEHTSDAENSRFSILRHFSYKAHVLTLTLVAVPDVFAVRPPRLQILRPDNQTLLSTEKEWQSEERDRLRLEITMWWKGVKDHIVHLEDYLESGNTTGTKKKLPAPPPPEAEAEGESTADAPTPKARPAMLPRSDSSASQMSQRSQSSQSSAVSTSNGNLPSVTSTTSSVSSAASAPVVLLGNLRHAFQATEQALYASLNKTPVYSVNDVRRLFLSSAKAASKRLAAWQAKHASGAEEVVGKVYYPEPEWWAPGCHSLPGGSVVVREGEWASVIAFTLR
jgi:1-phosphatidylinositol-3-phosphate 5-kinase